ncbi:MAG TPA: AbrB/MazE/SpoVT family DNA-binding domain-containing protein [Telluria sp.]|jgi:antitoxin MazE|nr:AbrB/MazE/SpoVT family DNA-binding domain-containing protein [Telluria sp.]
MQVSKWGNSLAVRLPATVIEALGLKAGDDVEIHVHGERVFSIAKKAGRAELLKKLRAYRGSLPVDFIFDRDAANERG